MKVHVESKDVLKSNQKLTDPCEIRINLLTDVKSIKQKLFSLPYSVNTQLLKHLVPDSDSFSCYLVLYHNKRQNNVGSFQFSDIPMMFGHSRIHPNYFIMTNNLPKLCNQYKHTMLL